MKKDLTTGSVLKNVICFSLPYLLSYFLQTLYGMADLFIIGKFDGTAATTAVSVGSQVMHMITVTIVGLAMGSTVTIGQAIGAKKQKRAAESIGNTVTMFMALSLLLTAILIIFVRPIVSVMSTPTEAADGTAAYLTVCFIGIPFITAYNIISSIFRGMGDSKSPMYFIAIACAANIVLDLVFMGAFELGPVGAALGTTLSQAISVFVSLAVVLKKKIGITIGKRDLKPNRPIIGRILKIGIPIALQDGFIQIAFIIIMIIANKRGLNDAAAVGIVEKIIGFIFLIPSSMLSTVSALGAQNIGAGKKERAIQALRYGIVICVCFGIAAATVVQFVSEPAVGLFTKDAAVISAGGKYFRGYIWDCIFAGVHFCFSGYFCALGKSGISFMHNIISILAVRIPGVYLTSTLFPDTMFPMGLATAAGSVLSVIICVIAFYVISRRDKKTAA